MSTMKPLFDKVIIERDTLQQKLKTDLYIPETIEKRNAPSTGTIISIGPDTEQVAVGDRVLFGLHAGSWIKDDDDNEFFVCLDADILAILEDA